jgi:hypothetical protein
MTDLKKISYTHDAIIDAIIAAPGISQGELAKEFGYTQTWLSIMIGSDAFQNRLAERKAAMTDPKLVASINERLDGLAKRALERLADRLDSPTANLKTMELVSIAKLAIGDKANRPATPTSQNLYVVNIPPAATSSSAWLDSAGKTRGVVEIIENEARG